MVRKESRELVREKKVEKGVEEVDKGEGEGKEPEKKIKVNLQIHNYIFS